MMLNSLKPGTLIEIISLGDSFVAAYGLHLTDIPNRFKSYILDAALLKINTIGVIIEYCSTLHYEYQNEDFGIGWYKVLIENKILYIRSKYIKPMDNAQNG